MEYFRPATAFDVSRQPDGSIRVVELVQKEVPTVKVKFNKDVYPNRLDFSDVQEIRVADSEIEKLLLEKDDLLVVEGNGSRDQVGRIARWDCSVNPCVHQNHVIKVRLGERKVAPWALYFFLSPSGRALIEEQAKTSTGLYNLSSGKVANLAIPLPPLAEQAAIVARVETLLGSSRKLGAKLAQIRFEPLAVQPDLLSQHEHLEILFPHKIWRRRQVWPRPRFALHAGQTPHLLCFQAFLDF